MATGPTRQRDLLGFLENPVYLREIRSRLRGFRAFGLILAYVAVLAFVTLLVLSWAHENSRTVQYRGRSDFAAGKLLFQWICGVQAVLLLMIAPAATASTVTAERESGALDLLATTSLSAGKVVLGKLAAALSFVGLLLVVGLPFLSVGFLLGGVSPGEIGMAYAQIGATAALYGAAGLYWSATLGRTVASTAMTYLCAFTHFIGTLLSFIVLANQAPMLLCLNPIYSLHTGSEVVRVFGHQVPLGAGAFGITVLATILLTQSARGQLQEFHPRPAPGARLVGILLLACLALAFTSPQTVRGWFSATNQGADDRLDHAVDFVLPIALAMGAWLGASAPARLLSGARGALWAGWRPSRWFLPGSDSAAPFVLISLLSTYAAIAAEGFASPGQDPILVLERLFGPFLVTLSMALFLVALGNMLVLILRDRNRAICGSVVVVVALFVIWTLMLLGEAPTAGEASRFLAIAEPGQDIRIAGALVPVWQVNAVLFSGLAILCWTGGALRAKAHAAKKPPEPQLPLRTARQ